MPALIQDGYTITSRLEPMGNFGPVTVRYRPALAEDVMEFLHQRDLVQGRAQIKPITDFLSRHVVGWDIKDDKGDVTPVTAHVLSRLFYGHLNQLLDHVMGYARGEDAAVDAKNSAGA